MLFQPGGQCLDVEGDQCRDVGLVVADHHALADQPVGADAILEHGRGDVLAAGGDDEFLLAPGDPQEAVSVELTDVATVEPAVRLEDLLGRLLVLPVPLEDLATLEHDLAVVGDADRSAGHRPSHRADADRVGQVDRARR